MAFRDAYAVGRGRGFLRFSLISLPGQKSAGWPTHPQFLSPCAPQAPKFFGDVVIDLESREARRQEALAQLAAGAATVSLVIQGDRP